MSYVPWVVEGEGGIAYVVTRNGDELVRRG